VRPFIILGLLCLSLPAWAGAAVTFPVSIPQECVALAEREGVRVVIENKYEAAKARIKLTRLSGTDPLVRECRAAIARHRQAARQ
jgi:hypothetical protein